MIAVEVHLLLCRPQAYLIRGRNQSSFPWVTVLKDRVEAHPREHGDHQESTQTQHADV